MGAIDPKLQCFLRTSVVPEGEPTLVLHGGSGAPGAIGNLAKDSAMRVFIRSASAAGVTEIASLHGVFVRTRLNDLLTAEVTPAGLAALQKSTAVLYVEAARLLRPANATVARTTKIDIPSGPLSHSGKGVIVGVVDWGCDFTHDDFRNADGSTRLIAFWDQTAEPAGPLGPPSGYMTGVEFKAEAMDVALKATDPYAALGLAPPSIRAHGTHVLGIAAGNGRALPSAGVRGLAPDADLIFVQPDTSDVQVAGGFGDSVHLAEAVHYIFTKAAQLRRPAVINLSMGTNSGPHDGTTLVEQWIDSLLQVPGRAVVLALGNEHHERFNRTHSEGQLRTGDSTSLYWRVLPGDGSMNEMEIWYSSRDQFEARVQLPDGSLLPAPAPGSNRMDVLVDGHTQVFQSSTFHSPLNGDNQINVIVVPARGGTVPAGVWQVHLTAVLSRDGAFDAWIERDSMQGSARMSSFLGGSYVRRKTLGSIQSARLAITVSNYDSITTTLADSTSFGPTRDGRRAPTVAAPGVDIRAARSVWRSDPQEPTPYVAMTGTSMSAPFVAGLVACMLQKNPRLTAAQLRGILGAQAKPAPGFNDDWRNDWGSGRVDPIDSLAATPEISAQSDGSEHGNAVLSTTTSEALANDCRPTPAHVEGPFYRPGAPELLDLYPPDCDGPVLRLGGIVSDVECRGMAGALIDIWHADDHGRYDNDNPEHPPGIDEFRCRGRLRADSEGRFQIRTVLPRNYAVDPEGKWIRVKHLHFKVYVPGYAPLTTEVALMPDDYASSDQLFNPGLVALMERQDLEQGRESWKTTFQFVLPKASSMGYAAAYQAFEKHRKEGNLQ